MFRIGLLRPGGGSPGAAGAGSAPGQARTRRAFILPSMKRLAASSSQCCLPASLRSCVDGWWGGPASGFARFCHPYYSRSSGARHSSSPAHEGIRGAGAPSMRRHSTCGQGSTRAHPPVEPARDRGTHRLVPSLRLKVRPQPRDVESGQGRTRSHRGGARRGCRPGGALRRRWRCGGPKLGGPPPGAAGAGGWRRRLESRASACGHGQPW